jgi:hypothetical protein
LKRLIFVHFVIASLRRQSALALVSCAFAADAGWDIACHGDLGFGPCTFGNRPVHHNSARDNDAFSGQRLGLKPLAVNLPIEPTPVAIVTLKDGELPPVGNLFIERARSVGALLAKRSP